MESPAPLLKATFTAASFDGHDLWLSPGFERGRWRLDALVEHAMEWLPEFALNHTEIEELQAHNAFRMIRRAAKSIYQTDKYGKRGEFGELFLHIALRQIYSTLPAVSKIYYKTGVNDTVKGFDAVHVVPKDDGLELWIGETKYYKDLNAAIRDVCDEIVDHLATDYLRNEFLLISNKIDDDWEYAERLASLLDENTSLDDVFSRAAIPVLLTYESESITKCGGDESLLKDLIEPELQEASQRLRDKLSTTYQKAFGQQLELTIHFILFPLEEKQALTNALHERLRGVQG